MMHHYEGMMLSTRRGHVITDVLNFSGFKHRDSLTSILVNLGLSYLYDTVLAAGSFMHSWNSCSNHVLRLRHLKHICFNVLSYSNF